MPGVKRLVGGLVGIVVLGCAIAPLMAQRPAAVSQPAAASAISSRSQLSLDGGPFHQQEVIVGVVTGDWFATARDGHASLQLAGTAGGETVRLDLQWDGPALQHVISAEINSDVGGAHSSFYLRFAGPAGSAIATPTRGDPITITVDRIDDSDLRAQVSGSATSSIRVEGSRSYQAIRISGRLVLHRTTAAVRPRSGSYGSCDPVIYDKYLGAESRSTSECETRFDADVRHAIGRAFDPALKALAVEHWQVTTAPKVAPIEAAARHTETSPFQMNFTSGGTYSVDLSLDPSGEVYQRYQRQFHELTARAGKEVPSRSGATPMLSEVQQFSR